MRKIALKIEYDGTSFSGWQMQPEERTVQECLERAVKKATNSSNRVVIHGAGRTDAGVHAEGQVAHFSTDSSIKQENFKHAINYWLSNDVAVIDSQEASPDFHARFSSTSKIYIYRILLSDTIRPLRDRYCYRHPPNLNLDNLNTMARKIIGEHDFTSFTNADAEVEDRVRTIYESEWHKMNDELRYRVRGNGFTYNMIRILVGTMCEIAAKGKPADVFDDITDARDRCAAGPTAPARGLILARIEYPPEVNPFQ